MEVGPLNSMIVIFQGNCCVTRGCFCLNFVELEANSAFLDPLLHLCRVSSISKHHLKSTKKCCSCDRPTRPCNVAYQMVSALRHCFFHCILALKFAWLCPFQGLFWLGSEWRPGTHPLRLTKRQRLETPTAQTVDGQHLQP